MTGTEAPQRRGPTVLTLETSGLGDRSYLAHDGEVALVVDPQRDIDRVTALAAEAGVVITHVLETHVHNDYVTGGLALARATGATYLMSADDEVAFERVGLRDGDVLDVGSMRVRAVHTPGHTHTHLSYALESEGETLAVFTGGSLLFGSTGRPDLLGPEHTGTLVRSQWRSARRLAEELPDSAAVYPTHGFGSFCSATQSAASESTIGVEKEQNPALTQDEATYVEGLLAGLEEYPAYYAHMAARNEAGPDAPDLSAPRRADPEELRARMDAGEWVVDLRTREAFAAGHLPGALNFGLDGPFVTYLGWLIPWGTPVTLLGDSPEDVAQAQRELSRIGVDRPAAAATGSVQEWAGDGPLSGFPRATFADLRRAQDESAPDAAPVVVDVRRASEHAAGHVVGALNLPIHEAVAHLDDVPRERLWVHCAGGYRASVVAALLDAAGHDVVAVDEPFDAASAAGLSITTSGQD